MKRHLESALILLLWSTGLPTASATPTVAEQTKNDNPAAVRAARPPEVKEQLERRLESVSTLIEKSSAAKQIESSAVPQALALRAKARELRQQADNALKAGNLSDVSRLLDQASKTMFDGVRLASPEQVTGEKKQRDFDNRMESVKALLAAQKRISVEKRLGAKGTETSNTIEAQIRDAAALAAAGKLDQGRALLDKVYLTTKLAVEGLRQGDTLVRSLHFASKEEEYLYEVDRNDTHNMLIKVLLNEKRANNAVLESTVQKYLEEATVLRGNAESMAAKKNFESGIKLLEDSTKELVRAIRGAGVYIPG